MEPIEQIASLPATQVDYSGEYRRAIARKIRTVAESLRALLRPSLIATVLTFFGTFGLAAVQGIILARLLGPEARGEFGTAIFYATTFMYIGLMGTQFAVARRAANDPSQSLQLSRAALPLGIITGLITILIVAILAFTTLPIQKQYLAPLCVVCALALPMEHVRWLLLAVDQGTGAFRRYNFVTIATSSVFPLLLLVLWMCGKASVVTAAILTLAGPVVGLVLRLAIDRPRPRWTSAPSPAPATLLKEGCPYLFSQGVCDLYQRFDQFLLLWMGSFVTQGLYAAAVPAASMLQVGTNALALFSFNAGSRQKKPVTRKQLLRAGILLGAFQFLIAAALAILVGPLIVLFYGREFSGAVPFALALIPAHAINGFAQVTEGHLRGRGKVNVGIWARIVAAATAVAFVMLTFDRLHVLSIPLAACLGNALVAATLAWVAFADVGRMTASTRLQPGEAPG